MEDIVEYYTLKEILLGLRQEQIRIQNELYELEKMLITYDNDKYKGSSFSDHIISKYQLLYYQLVFNYSLKERIYNMLFESKSLFNSSTIPLHTTIDEEGYYTLNYQKESLVKGDKKEEFHTKVLKLIQDGFIKNEIMFCDEFKKINFKIASFGMEYICNNQNSIHDIIFFRYIARENVLYIGANKKDNNSFNELIDDLLNIKIPKRILPVYLKNIIETNGDTNKNIITFEDKYNYQITPFYLNQEKDCYILVKKK